MVHGSIKFSGLAVAEGTFSFLNTTVSLKSKAAFVDPSTGKTHGWTETSAGWSKETLVALDAVRELMERDLARVHFESIQETGTISTSPNQGGPPGIRENLGSGDDSDQI